jgi:hypothetical protein
MVERKPPFWETPRNVAALLIVVAIIAAVVGYEIGQNIPQSRVVIINVPAQASK